MQQMNFNGCNELNLGQNIQGYNNQFIGPIKNTNQKKLNISEDYMVVSGKKNIKHYKYKKLFFF